jgi:hypothetical protein
MDNQLYTYKCVCYVDGEEVHRAGIIAATSYGEAATAIEELNGPELGVITHLCCLATNIVWFPCTEKGSNEDLVDLIEADAF